MFPSPYGVISLITPPLSQRTRPCCFRPLTGLSISLPISLKGQYLCGLSRCFAAETQNPFLFGDFFAFSRKVTFCFSLIRLSPILNHVARVHLHQLITISGALYHVRRYALLSIPIMFISIRESCTYNR